ncbi:hypothetical protein B0H63DRAFT_427820 [Podospora didyma]|uniref:NmrA-like domain-containing protein n=1 Tax=Podospora didyma TaxID=330526 RepID=A0AAE0NXD9_9PEZI|nr:hypothetical protein B0H63DRAFT_427820 [Podospora didyma]
MSTTITKVALAGATGNLGPAILEQLIKAGFEVTVLTREGSKHTYPAGVTAIPVNYDSLDSLVAALKGQDAVVSTIGGAALDKQLLLIEAAAQAGVKRFIPSEFGSNTSNSKVAALPAFGGKVAVQAALKEKAAAGTLSYTFVITGPFLDWGLQVGFLLDVKGKQTKIFDDGNRPFSVTTLPAIGQAVAAVLKKPAETENRTVYVHEAAVTQNQLLALAKKAVGSDGWTEEHTTAEAELAEGWAELKKENPSPHFIFKFISAAIFGEGYGSHFEKTDNELLGIKQLSEAELLELVKRFA